MKVLLDLDALLAGGKIGAAEYARLKAFAVKDSGSLALNILIGFGVIATAGGALALIPSAAAAAVLGLALAFSGLYLINRRATQWGVLGTMLLLIGAIAHCGAILTVTDGSAGGFLLVTLILAGGAVLAKSGLLATLATLALSSTIGAASAYQHATYEIIIQQPALTVAIFSLLAWGSYRVSLRAPHDYQRLALIVARASLFLVNMGFWVGSLWGDTLQRGRRLGSSGQAVIPDWLFAVAWAAALISVGVWAARQNRRWVVNLVAVFGAIHFYTQYFERLHASPATILFAGIVALGIAMALVRYNRQSGSGD